MSRFKKEWFTRAEIEYRCRDCGIRPPSFNDPESFPPADSSEQGQRLWRRSTVETWVRAQAAAMLVSSPRAREHAVHARANFHRAAGSRQITAGVAWRDVLRSSADRTVRRFFS